MTDHDHTADRDDVRELLGAYALDAIDDDERAHVERLLADDAAARAEVARYVDAIAAYASAQELEVDPPADAWTGIEAAVSQRRAAAATSTTGATVTALAPRRRWHDSTVARVLIGVAAAVVVLAVGLALRDRNPSAADQLASAITETGARSTTMTGTAGDALVVVTPDGTGWIDTRSLDALPAGRVYQLWLLDSGTPVSLGALDANAVTRFTAPATSSTLALSEEAAPSAATPTLPPVAAGNLT